MHPSARIAAYLCSALAVPGLSFFGLGILLGSTLLAVHQRLARVFNLLWRTRWLFLLLFLGNAFSLPGEPAWVALGAYAPTWEGLSAGALHCARLLAILLLLDLFVLSLPREPQLAGLYGLLRPFEIVGVPADTTTVRLGLTLQAMELPVEQRGTLRELFTGESRRPPEAETFSLTIMPWRPRDSALLAAFILFLALLWRYA
jgi:energy-coupling factor transporter transmembrane protein EcfT